MPLSFELSDKEEQKYIEWREELESRIPCPYVGAVGGAYSFTFIPTGIGTIVVAKRSDGHEINLTDFENW